MELEERREGAFERLAGGVLIFEGLMVLIHRFLVDVYLVASEANHGDETHAPMTTFLPWLLASAALAAVVIWAGAQLRRVPPPAWAEASGPARTDLVVAALLNVALVVIGALGLIGGPDGAVGFVGWASLVGLGTVSVGGLALDARATASR